MTATRVSILMSVGESNQSVGSGIINIILLSHILYLLLYELDGRQTTTVAATSYALSERTVTRARSPDAQRRTAEVVLAGITGRWLVCDWR